MDERTEPALAGGFSICGEFTMGAGGDRMDQWGWFGIFAMLIIIASGVFGIQHALAGIAGDLSGIHEEIQGLRSDLYRERHPREEPDPFE